MVSFWQEENNKVPTWIVETNCYEIQAAQGEMCRVRNRDQGVRGKRELEREMKSKRVERRAEEAKKRDMSDDDYEYVVVCRSMA